MQGSDQISTFLGDCPRPILRERQRRESHSRSCFACCRPDTFICAKGDLNRCSQQPKASLGLHTEGLIKLLLNQAVPRRRLGPRLPKSFRPEDWAAVWASQDEELSYWIDEDSLEGTVPAAVSGTFFRNDQRILREAANLMHISLMEMAMSLLGRSMKTAVSISRADTSKQSACCELHTCQTGSRHCSA